MHLPYWINSYLSETEAEQLASVVALSEKKTNAEIVPMIVKSSTSSLVELSRVGLLIALATSLILGQLVLFLVFGALYLGHRKYRKEKVFQRAVKEFQLAGITQTKSKTGVLIFISLKEKQIVVLADEGINDFTSSNTWIEITTKLIHKIKHHHLAQGVAEAIIEVAQVCSKIAPPVVNDLNEISDKVVIKE